MARRLPDAQDFVVKLFAFYQLQQGFVTREITGWLIKNKVEVFQIVS
jgi:hypothetical protein